MKKFFSETAYVLPENIKGKRLLFNASESHHLTRVLRKQVGDYFLATDGIGTMYECQIEKIESNELAALIQNTYPGKGEPQFRLRVCIALIKKSRFEFVIEKGSELGVIEFVPMITKYTVQPQQAFTENRIQKVAISAIKQCCRAYLPSVTAPQQFQNVIVNTQQDECKFIADERIETVDADLVHAGVKNAHSAVLLVGPEGGFSEEEIDQATVNGFTPIRLGPRRLRSETAAIAAITVILRSAGELS